MDDLEVTIADLRQRISSLRSRLSPDETKIIKAEKLDTITEKPSKKTDFNAMKQALLKGKK